MDREKKVIRFKKSITTISDLLAKEGVASVFPFGGTIYEITKSLFNHGRTYFKDRTDDRIKTFHEALLKGNADNDDFDSFLKKPFDLDDYYAVLSSCVQDIENEKVWIYSTLMSSLIISHLNQALKRHFIKSCKELTYSELCFLRELYINNKYDLMTVGGIQQQIKKMLTTKNALRLLTIDKLKSFGFINADVSGITSMAEDFVSMIFNAHSLLPGTIGRKPFSGINVAIITYQLSEKIHQEIATEIQ